MNTPESYGLYSILTNPLRGYEYLTKLLTEQEIPYIQLREKTLSSYQVLKIAEMMRKITEGTHSKLIINDNLDITLDCEADGIHVGQDDLSVEDIRSRSESLIIGLSTHTIKQVEEANKLNPTYIGVGPVFDTTTKENADPSLGIDTMKEMITTANMPAVAIGGISLDRIKEVVIGGAKNFALVSPLCNAENPSKILQQIQNIYRETLDQ